MRHTGGESVVAIPTYMLVYVTFVHRRVYTRSVGEGVDGVFVYTRL